MTGEKEEENMDEDSCGVEKGEREIHMVEKYW